MSEPKQRVTAERACMEMNRIEELLATTKLNDMMHKKDDDQKTTVLWILAIIGAVAAVAAIAYAVYCFFTPDYLSFFHLSIYPHIEKAGIFDNSCLRCFLNITVLHLHH